MKMLEQRLTDDEDENIVTNFEPTINVKARQYC